MKILFFSLFLTLCCSAGAEAINLVASGGVTRNIGPADLISGAGSNTVAAYGDGGATTLAISGTTGSSDNWRIDARRSDAAWSPATKLYVRRITDGSGSGSVTGGQSYVEITGNNVQLFSGAGDRSGVSLSYEMSGMSVTVPANIYSTTIIYTVVDTP